MARRKRKVKQIRDDDFYTVDMEIKKDAKGFSLDVYSGKAMTQEEIVICIETWLHENILIAFPVDNQDHH